MLLQEAKTLLESTRSVASNIAASVFIRLIFLLFCWTKKHLAANMMSGGGSAKEVSSADEPQASDATNRVVIDIRDDTHSGCLVLTSCKVSSTHFEGEGGEKIRLFSSWMGAGLK